MDMPPTSTDTVIQDGGCQTGSSYCFCSIIDRNEIPTATPRFSGSADTMDLSPTPKFKMAAAKPEVVIPFVL